MRWNTFRCKKTFKIILIAVCLVLVWFLEALPRWSIYPSTRLLWLNYTAPVTRPSRHLSKTITVVFRQFEEFENDVADSVQSFVSAFPNMPILVLCQRPPYPPFPFSLNSETLRNVKVISLQFGLLAEPDDINPMSHISTEFTLVTPDSTRVSRRVLQQALEAAIATSNSIAISIGNGQLSCHSIHWNYSDWTLGYKTSTTELCDGVYGHHALLVRTSILKSLSQPFLLPFPESLYLQTSSRHNKIQILDSRLPAGRSVLKTPMAKQRSLKTQREHRYTMYKQLGVKVVVKENGKQLSFGCKRESQRCFPTVQGVPSYVLSGRFTPPCCRRHLQMTITRVLRALTSVSARFWLETTSLLGAVVSGDLLPWAEYAEIGIHAADITRVTWLFREGVDPEGFVWERATKGRYYRVAYSPTNRVYALLLPFVVKNGTMWPDDWVLAHQKPFSDRHLHPLAQISFAGIEAPAPNDARAFLDHKLGHNSVERCQKIGPKLLYP